MPLSTPIENVTDPTPVISRRWKIIISVLLILHVAAVFICPLSIEGSPIAGRLWLVVQPYVQAAYLNHGYHFFAPQPGPSHLLRFELEMADGTSRSGVIPNVKQNRPRVFYHRHFMLTEFLNMLHGQTEGITDAASQPRKVFERYSQSYANHLLNKYHAQRVTIHLVRHLIPFPDEVLKGKRLDDPTLYQEIYKRTYVAEES